MASYWEQIGASIMENDGSKGLEAASQGLSRLIESSTKNQALIDSSINNIVSGFETAATAAENEAKENYKEDVQFAENAVLQSAKADAENAALEMQASNKLLENITTKYTSGMSSKDLGNIKNNVIREYGREIVYNTNIDKQTGKESQSKVAVNEALAGIDQEFIDQCVDSEDYTQWAERNMPQVMTKQAAAAIRYLRSQPDYMQVHRVQKDMANVEEQIKTRNLSYGLRIEQAEMLKQIAPRYTKEYTLQELANSNNLQQDINSGRFNGQNYVRSMEEQELIQGKAKQGVKTLGNSNTDVSALVKDEVTKVLSDLNIVGNNKKPTTNGQSATTNGQNTTIQGDEQTAQSNSSINDNIKIDLITGKPKDEYKQEYQDSLGKISNSIQEFSNLSTSVANIESTVRRNRNLTDKELMAEGVGTNSDYSSAVELARSKKEKAINSVEYNVLKQDPTYQFIEQYGLYPQKLFTVDNNTNNVSLTPSAINELNKLNLDDADITEFNKKVDNLVNKHPEFKEEAETLKQAIIKAKEVKDNYMSHQTSFDQDTVANNVKYIVAKGDNLLNEISEVEQELDKMKRNGSPDTVRMRHLENKIQADLKAMKTSYNNIVNSIYGNASSDSLTADNPVLQYMSFLTQNDHYYDSEGKPQKIVKTYNNKYECAMDIAISNVIDTSTPDGQKILTALKGGDTKGFSSAQKKAIDNIRKTLKKISIERGTEKGVSKRIERSYLNDLNTYLTELLNDEDGVRVQNKLGLSMDQTKSSIIDIFAKLERINTKEGPKKESITGSIKLADQGKQIQRDIDFLKDMSDIVLGNNKIKVK